jgi:hypothetical protein
MGGVTANSATFMDMKPHSVGIGVNGVSGRRFANSGDASGDKLTVLQQLCLCTTWYEFVGLPLMPRRPTMTTDLESSIELCGLDAVAVAPRRTGQGDNTAIWFWRSFGTRRLLKHVRSNHTLKRNTCMLVMTHYHDKEQISIRYPTLLLSSIVSYAFVYSILVGAL